MKGYLPLVHKFGHVEYGPACECTGTEHSHVCLSCALRIQRRMLTFDQLLQCKCNDARKHSSPGLPHGRVSPSERDSTNRGPGPAGTQEIYSIHSADVNKADIVFNDHIIHAIELLFSPENRFPLDLAVTAFIDVFTEVRKLERLQELRPTDFGDLIVTIP